MSDSTRRGILWMACCMAAIGVGGIIGDLWLGAAFAAGGLAKGLILDGWLGRA